MCYFVIKQLYLIKRGMSSNMVRDNEIKATVSPFAIRPGEIKVFDGKDGYG